MVVQEYVRWFDECVLAQLPVVVSAEPDFASKVPVMPHDGKFEFGVDLAACGEMLARAVAEVRANRPVVEAALPVRILEVACGSDPQSLRAFQPGTQVIALDLCFPQAQLASLIFKRDSAIPSADFALICENFSVPPFQDGSFDVVMICATLHHFADATKLWKRWSGCWLPACG